MDVTWCARVMSTANVDPEGHKANWSAPGHPQWRYLLTRSYSHHGVVYALLYISLLNHIHILELFTLYCISLDSITFTSWSCLHSTVSLLIQSYSHHGVVYTLLYLS